LREHHPESIDPAAAKLADAQLVLARSYRASSWTRLVNAVRLADAIWRDDPDRVRALITRNPALIHEHVLIRTDSNWGAPMTYAANLGRDRIIRLLHSHGARDFESAAGRAALQSKADTVRLIYDLMGRPSLDKWTLAGPAYTLNVEGTAVLLTLGARVAGPDGVDRNTMEHLLGTDSRNPPAKHRILEMYVEHGFEPPDTPVMALHRGRIDLLEAHLARDPDLLTRTFDITDVFPLAPASAREPYTAQGTPVHGTTLLHIAAYFDEVEIAAWLLDRGMDPDVRAAIDADGFGGYTALYSTVVSQRNFWVNYGKRQPVRRSGASGPRERRRQSGCRGPRRSRRRSALHAPPAGPPGPSQHSGVLAGTPRGGTRRRSAPRVPGRDAAGLGRAVPREDLREPGVASVDRGPGRQPVAYRR
jgi:hypothetical protein